MRYAIRRGAPIATPEELVVVQRYLPVNYEATLVKRRTGSHEPAILIKGEDVAGWTLDGYVRPRLASGLRFFVEITATEANDYTRA